MITEAAPRIAVFYKSFLKLISVIRKYFLHVIKKTGNLKAEIIIISRLFYMVLYILFKAGLIISTWETFLSSAGKQTPPPFWFVILSSPLISNQFDLGLAITLCLPETFNSKYLFFDPPTQTLCEEILCLD